MTTISSASHCCTGNRYS